MHFWLFFSLWLGLYNLSILTDIFFFLLRGIVLSNEDHIFIFLSWFLLFLFASSPFFWFILWLRLSFFISLGFLGYLSKCFESFEAATVSIFFDIDGFFLWLENVHKLLDLGDRTLFWFVLVHIWQIFKNDLDIVDSLRQNLIDLLADGWAVSSECFKNYLTGSQGEFLPISRRAYKLLMWYSERKISLLRLRTWFCMYSRGFW